MSTAVKYFGSHFAGAPTLTGTAGSLIGLLDACLVDGYALRSVDSLTVAGGVATANISIGHPYPVSGVVLIAGATPTELNGEKRVLSATANSFTFAAPGVPNGAASGSITSKMAPAGWVKAFSGTNRAAYRNNGTGAYLRVFDGNATHALVRGFMSMTDVDTGTEAFPNVVQSPNGLVWKKSNEASSATRPWRLAADDKLFHFVSLWRAGSAHRGGGWYVFGDLVSYVAGDAYHAVIQGAMSDHTEYHSTGYGAADLRATQPGKYIAADMTSVSKSIPYSNSWMVFIEGMGTNEQRIVSRQGPSYPGAVDGGLHVIGPIPAFDKHGATGDDTGHRLRGIMPGLYQPLHNGEFLPVGQFTQSVVSSGLGGRAVLIAPVGAPLDTLTHGGVVALDVTGPWR